MRPGIATRRSPIRLLPRDFRATLAKSQRLAGQVPFVSPGRFGPDWPGASRRYLVLGRLKTPAVGAQRSSSWSTASRSARVSTLRARARPPPFLRLLSSDIRKLPAHSPVGGLLYLLPRIRRKKDASSTRDRRIEASFRRGYLNLPLPSMQAELIQAPPQQKGAVAARNGRTVQVGSLPTWTVRRCQHALSLAMSNEICRAPRIGLRARCAHVVSTTAMSGLLCGRGAVQACCCSTPQGRTCLWQRRREDVSWAIDPIPQ